MPVVTEAVGQAWRLRGGLATGWPVLAWIAKFKPDPLRRLHLDRLGAGRKRKEIDPAGVGRTSLPATSGVQRARVDTALRALADQAARRPDPGLVRCDQAGRPLGRGRAARPGGPGDRDHRSRPGRAPALVAAGPGPAVAAGGRRAWPVWAGWASAVVLAYLQLPPLPRVTWWGLPAPTVLAVGGVLAGLLLAGLARIGVEVGARRRVARARQALRSAIAKVTGELVVGPVRAEQERYEQARQALERPLLTVPELAPSPTCRTAAACA